MISDLGLMPEYMRATGPQGGRTALVKFWRDFAFLSLEKLTEARVRSNALYLKPDEFAMNEAARIASAALVAAACGLANAHGWTLDDAVFDKSDANTLRPGPGFCPICRSERGAIGEEDRNYIDFAMQDEPVPGDPNPPTVCICVCCCGLTFLELNNDQPPELEKV